MEPVSVTGVVMACSTGDTGKLDERVCEVNGACGGGGSGGCCCWHGSAVLSGGEVDMGREIVACREKNESEVIRPSMERGRLLGDSCAEPTESGLITELPVSALAKVPAGEKV